MAKSSKALPKNTKNSQKITGWNILKKKKKKAPNIPGNPLKEDPPTSRPNLASAAWTWTSFDRLKYQVSKSQHFLTQGKIWENPWKIHGKYLASASASSHLGLPLDRFRRHPDFWVPGVPQSEPLGLVLTPKTRKKKTITLKDPTLRKKKNIEEIVRHVMLCYLLLFQNPWNRTEQVPPRGQTLNAPIGIASVSWDMLIIKLILTYSYQKFMKCSYIYSNIAIWLIVLSCTS